MEEIRPLNQENFVALFLDTKNQVKHKLSISIVILNASILHPRETFRKVIKRFVASIIVVHIHLSGDPVSSQEDNQVTRRLVETEEITRIDVLDHIIIGDYKFMSFKKEGLYHLK